LGVRGAQKRKTADDLTRWMTDQKHKVSLLRGGEDFTPEMRDRIMRQFREGETKVRP
jgi:hypothetical protein